MKKIIGIILFIISGFFLSIIPTTCFYQFNVGRGFLLAYGMFLIPFLVTHLIALACYGFKKWKMATGIVFVSVGGYVLSLAGMMYLFTQSPEAKQLFSQQMPTDISFNVSNGLVVTLLFIFIGLLLIKLEKTAK